MAVKEVAPETRDYITSFSQEFTADLDANGTATFKNVVPGIYNFSLLQRDGFHTYWRKTVLMTLTPSQYPLCDRGKHGFYYS